MTLFTDFSSNDTDALAPNKTQNGTRFEFRFEIHLQKRIILGKGSFHRGDTCITAKIVAQKNVNNRCIPCGRRNLREIKDDDFCFRRKLDAVSAENIKNKLSSEKIGCALVPQGTDINNILELKLENCLVFVEYRALDYVENLMQLEKQRLSDNLK